MNAPQMLQRMRMRSQLLLKPHTSMGLRRQPSLHSYRSQTPNLTNPLTHRPSSTHSLLQPSSSSHSFRPRFERILHEKKLHLLLDTQPTQKIHYSSTSKTNQIQKQITKAKKSLDDLIVQRKAIQNKNKRVKFQIDKIKRQRGDVGDNQQAEQNDVKYLVKRDGRLFNIEQQRQHSMLCYQQIRSRNQHQLILWKARYQQLTRYHQQYSTVFQQLILQQSSLLQTHSQTLLSLQSTRDLISQTQLSKQQLLIIHKQEIENKREIDKWKGDRGKQKEEFQQQAGVEQEKIIVGEYREYYLINKFLKRLLRAKGERVMDRYRYQHAGFEKIRQGTGLGSTGGVLERMQVQDGLYEEKIKEIVRLEEQLREIKEREMGQEIELEGQMNNDGFKERQLEDKIDRLKVMKGEKLEEVQEIVRFEAVMKGWMGKSWGRMGGNGEELKQGKEGIRRILEKLEREKEQNKKDRN